MNHLEKYFQTSLSNVLMNIRQNSKYAPVSCPKIIKFCNNGMDGVDIMDQKQLLTDSISKANSAFVQNMFFNLVDVTHVNSHIVYMKLDDNISSPEFQNYCSKRLSKQKTHEPSMTREVPIRMPEFW